MFKSTSGVNRISVPNVHTSNSNYALVIAIKPEAKTFLMAAILPFCILKNSYLNHN